MLRSSTTALVTLAGWLLAAPNAGAVGISSGENIDTYGRVAQLAGLVYGQQPIAYWTADGDGALENYVTTYDESAGQGAFGPLFDTSMNLWGWPSDLIEIEGTVYGVDTFFEQLYTLDPDTATVTPVTAPLGSGSWDTRLGSLAYDPATDRIYSVDWRLSSNRLFAIDRSTGDTVPPGGGPLYSGLPFADVLGLAWNASDSLLYLYDADSGEIHTLDPTDGSTAYVVTPDHGNGLFYDELAFYEGALYGTLTLDDAGTTWVQLRRIDLATGAARDVGPALEETDGHSLRILSMPARVVWSVDSGPGTVQFADAEDPETTVRFSETGEYVLRLSVEGATPASDKLIVMMRPYPRVATGAWPTWTLLAVTLALAGWRYAPRGVRGRRCASPSRSSAA